MKILVATDGSDSALRACKTFLAVVPTMDADVRILAVLSYELYPYALVAGEHLSNETEMEAAVGAKVAETTEPADQLLRAAGYRTTLAHRFGNPGDEILAEIDQWGPDLVVIGRRGVRGLERLLGSVSEHVIHRCRVPMFIA